MKTDEVLYKGYLKVEAVEDTIKGKPVKRERLVVDDAVAGVVVDARGRYGLVKQYRPTVGVFTYELVAGTCDKGLSTMTTLLEELEEECEIPEHEVNSIHLMKQYFVMVGISDTLMSIYEVHVSSQENKKVEDADVEEVVWVTFEEFTSMVDKGQIEDSKTLLGYYMEKSKKLQEGDGLL